VRDYAIARLSSVSPNDAHQQGNYFRAVGPLSEPGRRQVAESSGPSMSWFEVAETSDVTFASVTPRSGKELLNATV
jgi:hypothetical protein